MTHQKNLQLCPDSNSDLKWSKIDLLSIFDGRLSELWNDLVKNGELIGKLENQGEQLEFSPKTFFELIFVLQDFYQISRLKRMKLHQQSTVKKSFIAIRSLEL